MADKFFLNELFKSLIFSRQRLFVMILSVFLGALVGSAFLNIYFDLESKLSNELKAYGANVIISAKDGQNISNDDFLALKNELNPRALTPFLYDFLNFGSTSAVVLGTDFRALKLIKPFIEVKEGSFNLSDFGQNSIFLGVNLAKQLETKIGQNIEIYNQNNAKSAKFILKGIILSNDEFDSLALISLKSLQELSQISGINYGAAIVLGKIDEVREKAAKFSNEKISLKPISSVSFGEALVLDKIKALMFLIILIILIITSASASTTLSSVILSRKKEIALRLALGAKKSEIFKLFMSEYFLVSLFASVLGAFCGIFLALVFGKIIFGANIEFRFFAVLFAVLLSLIFAFVAMIFPIKKALEINICENLKGE